MKKEYKSTLTHQELKDKGFRYSQENQYYTYNFPVHKYNKKPVITCQVFVYEDNTIKYDVINASNGELYSSYYNKEYGRNDLSNKINKIINSEFKKIGIKNERKN